MLQRRFIFFPFRHVPWLISSFLLPFSLGPLAGFFSSLILLRTPPFLPPPPPPNTAASLMRCYFAPPFTYHVPPFLDPIPSSLGKSVMPLPEVSCFYVSGLSAPRSFRTILQLVRSPVWFPLPHALSMRILRQLSLGLQACSFPSIRIETKPQKPPPTVVTDFALFPPLCVSSA